MMGMLSPFSKCGCDNRGLLNRNKPKWQPPNPDPRRFEVENVEIVNGHTILVVKYPNCTNFEGTKILVIEGEMNAVDLANLKVLDPHFCEHNPSLIARFRPDRFDNAVRFCKSL
jgi:hypothetical protein